MVCSCLRRREICLCCSPSFNIQHDASLPSIVLYMYAEPGSALPCNGPFFRFVIIATTAIVGNACHCCHHRFVYSLCAIYLLWSCMRCVFVWIRADAEWECYLHVHFQLSGIKQGIKAHFNVVQNHWHELAQKYNYEYMSSLVHTERRTYSHDILYLHVSEYAKLWTRLGGCECVRLMFIKPKVIELNPLVPSAD